MCLRMVPVVCPWEACGQATCAWLVGSCGFMWVHVGFISHVTHVSQVGARDLRDLARVLPLTFAATISSERGRKSVSYRGEGQRPHVA